jgi:tetratricopeptide (TPR) repeat protein
MDSRDQLAQRIADCLCDLDRFWFFTPVMAAIDEHNKISKGKFHEGEIDLLAAAYIYLISLHNQLDQKDLINGLTLDDIAGYYGLEPEIILTRADAIHPALKMHENEKYREFDFSYLEDEDEEEEGESQEWMKVLAVFTLPSGESWTSEMEELVQELINEVNEDEEEDDWMVASELKIMGQQLSMELDGYNSDIDFFCHIMESNGFEFEKIVGLDHHVNRFTPTDHYAIFMEQHEVMDLGEQTFNSLEEIQDELDKFQGKAIDQIRAENPVSPEGEAMIGAIKAFKFPRLASIARVSHILQEHPNCVEAHICLAGWEDDASKRIALIEKALDAGERSLDLDMIDKRKMWWGDHRTRPYMRAMQILALELEDIGEIDQAIDLLWELIEMNEADNQGNRIHLLEIGILKRKWLDVRKLFDKYPNDIDLFFVYGKVIHLYYTLGKKSKTKKALLKAYSRNKYPLRLLAGIEEYPEPQPHFKLGDKTEATEVLDFLLACFEKDKKLMNYFFEVLIGSGVWEEDNARFDLTKNHFEPGARIIPFDKGPDN